MAEDDEFLRKFAVQIAAALREKEDASVEERQRQNQPSIDESVDDLLDLLSSTSVVASALSRQLSTSTSPYAISNRLVNGIIYICNQNATSSKQKKKETASEESSNAQNLNRDEKQNHSTIQVAMAKLAFCILVDLPLQCCRDSSSSSSHLKKIRRLLGTYKGADRSNVKQPDIQEEEMRQENKDSNSKQEEEEKVDTTINNEAQPSDNTQQIDTEEVWAAESDPSDFDYGEGDNDIYANSWLQPESTVDWLDPKELSKEDPNRTMQEIRDAIGSLLQLASYTLLEPIFCLPKKETLQYISRLTQLVLILLRPKTPAGNASTGDDDSLLSGSSMDDVILSPLWILRDAAIYHGKSDATKSTTSNYEQSYLQVLQNLLAMDQAHLQDMGKLSLSTKDDEPDLCVSSIVGLSSLSSWCASQTKPTQVTLDALVDSMNDLEHIMERGQQAYKQNLPNTLIPILESLSGIHYDRLNNNSVATAPYYRGSTIPQTLLNSGLLRQVLSLATAALNEGGSTNALGFHHALWGLCIGYPKIVGKYFFRYPGSSQIIRAYALQLDAGVPQICIEALIWNVYGWHQCKESSGGGGLSSLRKPGSVAPKKLTPDECSEVCQKAWSQLCNLVKEALKDSDPNNDAASERVIEEWGRLLVLASGTHIADQFKTLVDSSLLNDISSVVTTQLAKSQVRIESTKHEGKEDDDKDDKPSRKQKTVSHAHKLLKKYNLFFQGTTSG
eukprot:CAMPEP_0116140024 /NCGR_PEP_ID=MMETSP0329-20121206/13619_1 /TAXON_ID=697910 /ORGANISM="Pseudo-nitzschia arenysensis, Strain B593" /LENGTH=728 /DNA_ID=CAMNT_0003635095 /DNA_START=24 /DNA_END=2208 /DNA_ORIENTATION=+